ncbi:hypothetical protein BsWGS_23329 [Bradybaena similaris]
MSKEYEKALRVISKPPEQRYDHEINQLVPWFRSKAKLFKSLKADMLGDIIRNCDYVTKNRDDVIIKQGDVGECFYIVLNGKVTIYILNKDQLEGEEDDGNFDNIIEYTKDGLLDRSKLGYCVTSLESGAPFGDVALTSGDSIRTASIIADEHTDLLVVDRALYNRSVKEVLAKEFFDKTTFIKNNPLFSVWPAKYRKQLAMALYSETFGYESELVRQGEKTADMYFILSGHVEIQMDPLLHQYQYPLLFKQTREKEVDRLIKREDKSRKRASLSGSNSFQQSHGSTTCSIMRKPSIRCTRLCHLGVNESVGDVELTMDLATYMQTAVCKETTTVLVLESKHYERLFIRRHPKTIESMRNEIGVKLASRMAMLNTNYEIPFLHCLKKLMDSRHKPVAQTDRDKPEHTVFEAEKEFLNHKGPLIDQDGPGSVFYLIRVREKTKMRVQAKRGDRLDRHLPIASQSVPKSLALPLNIQMKPVLGPSTSRSLQSTRKDSSRSPRDSQNSVLLKEEPEDILEQNQNHDPRDDEVAKEWPSPVSTLGHEFGNSGTQNPDVRSLEDRMRQWLEADNPKGKPQVAQLRRLQDMEFQPRPGNRVVVKRKIRRPQEVADTPSLSSTLELDSEITEEAKLARYKTLLTY